MQFTLHKYISRDLSYSKWKLLSKCFTLFQLYTELQAELYELLQSLDTFDIVLCNRVHTNPAKKFLFFFYPNSWAIIYKKKPGIFYQILRLWQCKPWLKAFEAVFHSVLSVAHKTFCSQMQKWDEFLSFILF